MRRPLGPPSGRRLALALLLLAGCPKSAPPPPPMAMPDLVALPDLAEPPAPVDRLSCSEAKCLPPPCCGAPCKDDSQCCRGTVCAKEGRCAPAICAGCGEISCVVDYPKCSAACARPPCCLKGCATDGDCCPGTRCDTNSKGEKVCTPKFCDSCGGLAPICSVTVNCAPRCIPPASCGLPCAGDGECGLRSVCRAFLGGERYCVPGAFEAACLGCGVRGCLFFPDRCAVECRPAPPVDGGVGDGGGSDGAIPGDGGPVDAGAAVVDSAPPQGGPNCRPCCGPCAGDGDCCPGHRCAKDDRGRLACLPALCGGCQFGCRFYCPPE